jgi:hypothetical protein
MQNMASAEAAQLAGSWFCDRVAAVTPQAERMLVARDEKSIGRFAKWGAPAIASDVQKHLAATGKANHAFEGYTTCGLLIGPPYRPSLRILDCSAQCLRALLNSLPRVGASHERPKGRQGETFDACGMLSNADAWTEPAFVHVVVEFAAPSPLRRLASTSSQGLVRKSRLDKWRQISSLRDLPKIGEANEPKRKSGRGRPTRRSENRAEVAFFPGRHHCGCVWRTS